MFPPDWAVTTSRICFCCLAGKHEQHVSPVSEERVSSFDALFHLHEPLLLLLGILKHRTTAAWPQSNCSVEEPEGLEVEPSTIPYLLRQTVRNEKWPLPATSLDGTVNPRHRLCLLGRTPLFSLAFFSGVWSLPCFIVCIFLRRDMRSLDILPRHKPYSRTAGPVQQPQTRTDADAAASRKQKNYAARMTIPPPRHVCFRVRTLVALSFPQAYLPRAPCTNFHCRGVGDTDRHAAVK